MQHLLATPGFVDALSAIVVAVSAYLAHALGAYLRAHTKNAYVSGALDRAEVAAEMAVKRVYQTYVSTLKSRAEDGTLTADESKEALNKALDCMRTYVGKDGLDDLKKVVGPDALESFLKGQIEKAVFDSKALILA